MFLKIGSWRIWRVNLKNMTNPEMTYHPNGKINTISYRNAGGDYHVENKWVDGHKLIDELGINPDYTLWTDDEKDMFALHLILDVL